MIGDVLTSTILFEALKTKYSNAELHYVINSHTSPVVSNNPYIDKLILITPEIEANKFKFYKFLMSFKKKDYDVIIDVYGKISSGLISLFTKSKIKIAYQKKYSAFIYSDTFKRLKKPRKNASLAIENRMKLLEPLDIKFSNISPKIYLTNQETNNAKFFLESNNVDLKKSLYMISVLGSTEKKTYPFKYMSKLLDEIAKRMNSQILLNYIPKQQEIAKKILALCKPETQNQIFFNVYGKNLREFLAITYHCNALIGNEGGANNMAKALDIPTFTIFSPNLNKQNWFGNIESKKHVAVHLSDFTSLSETDIAEAKKNPETYYLKLEPKFIIPQLKSFLSNLD